ncbi:MAG: hypothetical protein PHN18_10560 [Sulfurospirillaceae bacterium]|nr:hypothetical protein [Sulfurospirillaceae bacterium]MDD2827418.1 hypothetical protein [Sulfurospirillaceae bacterium]
MIDFKKRLASLKERRQGSKERAIYESQLDLLSKNYALFSGQDLRKQEIYETLNESDSIKYAIGGMAPVDEKSTNISISEGQRVADSLIKSLALRGINATAKLQGSVALDVHIKGHSDVDMLIVYEDLVIVEVPEIFPHMYSSPSTPRSMVDVIKDIRLNSENILPKNFPQANIDCTGNKAIKLSEGSLLRKVDIVPASWYDTRDYQQTRQQSDRGIKIYHKNTHELELNLPFKHIKLISDRDDIYNGNLRSVIRLMKNIVADMPDYKQHAAKKLSSYDLASIAYHMEQELYLPYNMRVGLVEKIRAFLYLLFTNYSFRDNLNVPDLSRKIFNHQDKIKSLEILLIEFSSLAESIAKDIYPFIQQYDSNIVLAKKIA